MFQLMSLFALTIQIIISKSLKSINITLILVISRNQGQWMREENFLFLPRYRIALAIDRIQTIFLPTAEKLNTQIIP